VTAHKRHILVDTLGLLLSVAVHPAFVQDRDGAAEAPRQARGLFPFIERIFADAAYQLSVEIVSSCANAGSSSTPYQPEPVPGTRLRTLSPLGRRLDQARYNPHHAPSPHQPSHCYVFVTVLVNSKLVDRR